MCVQFVKIMTVYKLKFTFYQPLEQQYNKGGLDLSSAEMF